VQVQDTVRWAAGDAAGERGDVVAARQRRRRHVGAEEEGAAEHEQSHAPDLNRAEPPASSRFAAGGTIAPAAATEQAYRGGATQ
jgi:hypothetical protein